MIKDIVTAIFSYIGTTTDYFVVLLLLFGKYQSRKETKPVVIGAYIGNAILVLVSLIIAVVLQQVPAEWLLGLLGLIPIYMGIKSYFSDEDEGDEIEERLNNIQPKNILKDVILITFSACGADNMALYIPYFTTVSATTLPIIFAIFIVILTIVIYSAYKFVSVPMVKRFFDRQGDLIQMIVYVVLGLYVLLEAGSIQHIIKLVF
ncbi:permease [Leuconostoc mesenteroides subsp. dextranicum]|uniref:cadmium resistance transporter n=1 Tax=Leuconostoc mesenteroides TaxID=1245 RepID=UPI000682F765|nr:cadmium resistance transporter [Leuconostoc mesenteroides]KMY79287.1 permease [Leuconostoc mesenteroides subsp. dextranicum]MBZ1507561.1 cadmium resistance transporter [Leuconostoc mesenteroides]MCM6827777.1 CadD family cadmium resistance transporter [Leuconostoc mesenteroides]MCT3048088.1 permease [Leuconostoc mesenteroides]